MGASEPNDIFIEEEDLEYDELVDLLVPYIRIGKDTGQVLPTGKFKDLERRQQVLVLLLAQKLRVEAANEVAPNYEGDEQLKPSEIGEMVDLKVEDLYPAIRRLEQDGILLNRNGEYSIHPNLLNKAKQIIRED